MGDRAYKYINHSRDAIKNKNVYIDVKFDINELELMSQYVVSSNKSINRGSIINLRNLFGIIDLSVYDEERKKLIDYILKGIDARLNKNLTTTDTIVYHINGGFGKKDDKKIRELNNSEVAWINSTVSSILKDSIIYNDIDMGLSLLTKFKATDYKDRGSIVQEIEKWVIDLHTKFRRAKANDVNDLVFSLTGDNFKEGMFSTYDQLANPSNQLKFGVQALNGLTGGGVESGRVYTILGLPSEGKSSTLLDMAIQLKKYNKGYVCKDPTKRPCVVLLVMENGTKESIQRMFKMVTGKEITDYNRDEICDALNNVGDLKVSDDDPVDIIIKFRPNLSEDTSYLYTLVEDLEDEGYETIAVLQDYLKRIRSVEGSFGGDLRQQLGAVINEFKIFATLKDIPVITASQLNRVATASIDEARVKNKSDLVRLIGRSNVGESNLILENSDWICIITPEYDREGNKYLGIQRVKSRYYIPGNFQVAYLPYVGDSIKFIEDFNSPIAVHKETLKDQSLNESVEMGRGMIKVEYYDDIVREEQERKAKEEEEKAKKDDKLNIFLGSQSSVAYTIGDILGVDYRRLRPMCILKPQPITMCTYVHNNPKREFTHTVAKKPMMEMCTLVNKSRVVN